MIYTAFIVTRLKESNQLGEAANVAGYCSYHFKNSGITLTTPTQQEVKDWIYSRYPDWYVNRVEVIRTFTYTEINVLVSAPPLSDAKSRFDTLMMKFFYSPDVNILGQSCPTTTTTAPSGGWFNTGGSGSYVVKSGDTLSKIAARYPGVTVLAIKQANNLSSDTIRVGQTLTIPGISNNPLVPTTPTTPTTPTDDPGLLSAISAWLSGGNGNNQNNNSGGGGSVWDSFFGSAGLTTPFALLGGVLLAVVILRR